MIQFPKFHCYRWHRLLFIVVQALSRKTLIVLANDVRSFQFFFTVSITLFVVQVRNTQKVLEIKTSDPQNLCS